MTTTFTPDTDELRKIAELPTESALRRAARFLASLVKDPDFVGSQIFPSLEEATDSEDGSPRKPGGTSSRRRHVGNRRRRRGCTCAACAGAASGGPGHQDRASGRAI